MRGSQRCGKTKGINLFCQLCKSNPNSYIYIFIIKLIQPETITSISVEKYKCLLKKHTLLLGINELILFQEGMQQLQ